MKKHVVEVTPSEVHEIRISMPWVKMIDVRSYDEYQEVHVDDVLLVPLSELDPKKVREQYDLAYDEPLYFICRSGGRSHKAACLFQDSGFSNVFNVIGGITLWVKEDLPHSR